MGSRFQKKLALLAALAALVCTAALGALAYIAASDAMHQALRQQVTSSASMLAMRASDELKHVAERSRFYVSTNLQKGFETDGELMGLSLVREGLDANEPTDWRAELRWLLPATHPTRLSGDDFAELELKYPVDYARVADGHADVIFARSRGASALLRMAIPYGERSARGYTRAIIAEVKLGKLQALFARREDLFAFMTAARGSLVIASESGHFGAGEDLSKLSIFSDARSSMSSLGAVDYRETPQAPLQHAAFARVASIPGLTVFAQVPATRVRAQLEPLVLGMAAASLVFAALFAIYLGWMAPRWAWALLPGAEFKITVPAAGRRESDTARKTGSSPADGIPDARVEAPGSIGTATLAKIRDPRVRQAFENGKVKLSGERIETSVLHAHLHGIDKLSARLNPERLLQLLNEFHQKSVKAIESRGGMVDHLHGGSIVAFWGVPKPLSTDVTKAIQAASEIRAAAHELTEALERDGHEATRLAMGLHYGPLALGQVGAEGRLEYSAVGEGLEIAGRIQAFAPEFGTDFLMTGEAAKRAGKEFATAQLTAGDDGTPELHELSEAA